MPKKPEELDLSGVPIFFTEDLVGMMLGPSVSRITFGVQNEDTTASYPRPVVTLAIQTSTLNDLVSDLKALIDSEDFKKDMTRRLEKNIQKISIGVKSNPSDYVKEMLLEAKVVESPEESKASVKRSGAKSQRKSPVI
ncbi:hypothetical protein P2B09_12600 [Xanthomonas perforans]